MDLGTYLEHDWVPSLGCTEPASVAYAAARAAELATGAVRAVHLTCDSLVYRNCFAAGIPNSGGRTGVEWAAALGALLPDAAAELEVLAGVDADVRAAAARLLGEGGVTVTIDAEAGELLVDCRVERAGGTGRAVLRGRHTAVHLLERDGRAVPAGTDGEALEERLELDRWLRALSFDDCLRHAERLDARSRERLRQGLEWNLAIAREGLALLPASYVESAGASPPARMSALVCGGVCARMSGAERPVMTLAGSGNKGITASVPLGLWGEEHRIAPERLDAALVLACLLTSATSRRLGTVSSMCGAANAAGIGLAAGLVLLQGGGAAEVSRAVDNMVGNLAGMICDGAKLGCGLKTATAVDAACRAAGLAIGGFGVPGTDGIVGADGMRSLDHLERVASEGMPAVDATVLAILRAKRAAPSGGAGA